jgi:hypothetical protein
VAARIRAPKKVVRTVSFFYFFILLIVGLFLKGSDLIDDVKID